jgi:LuxR family maltose regulon positive regulatory protein
LDTHNTSLLQIAQAFQAELALRQGRITEINHWAKSFNPDPFVVAYRFYVPQMTLAKWFLAQETNESRPQAANLLSRLHEFFSSTHNTRLRIEVLALQALLNNAQDDETAALNTISEALTLAEPGGFIRLFVDLGPDMAALLRRCLSQQGPVSYIRKILAAFRDEGVGPEQDAAEENDGYQAATFSDQSPSKLLMKLRPQPGIELFTAREREVLTLLTQRLSYQEMADTLVISPKTVKRHVLTIYKKLGVHSRREAIERADELGFLSDR